MIYFDNAATTQVHPDVLSAYTQLLNDYYANQGSSHSFAMAVNDLVEKSRKSILEQLGLSAATYQVIFTSGATEANNLFLKGAALQYANRGKKIITSQGEHPSVIKPLLRLKADYDFEIVELPLNEAGVISINDLEDAMDENTILVSIMSVNNETGAINDIESINNIVKRYPKCLLHSDVTQALAKVELNYTQFDAFTFSSHKINGLKGSGALIMRKGLTLVPLIEGGTYEYGYRDGTPDSPKNIILAKTLKLAMLNFKTKLSVIKSINDSLRKELKLIEEVVINSPDNAIPHILSVSLTKHRSAIIASGLSNKGIMVGTSSACSSKLHAPSKTILAMFNDDMRANNVLRFSFGYFNDVKEVESLISELTRLLKETKHD